MARNAYSATEEQTSDFMHALAASDDVDAANISADRVESSEEMRVEADVATSEIGPAKQIAAEHGFSLEAEIGDGAGARGRFRFSTAVAPHNSRAVPIGALGETYTAVKLEQSDARTLPIHIDAGRDGVAF